MAAGPLLQLGDKDLVAGYTGSNEQIYLFDAADNSVHLVSHAAGLPTQAGNGGSGSADLSRDGRYVAFQSWARDLVDPPLPAPNGAQLFLWDRTIDSTRLVSHAALDPTEISDGRNSRPAISADGGYLAWTSDSTNLVEGFHGGYQYVYQVYLWSRDLDATMLASHADGDPTQAAGYGAAGDPSICSDGSRIAFVSDSYDLLPYGEYGRLDTYVFDRTSGSLRRVSQASADGGDFYPQSEIRSQMTDGRVTAFESDSWYVTPRDWNMALDVFLQGKTRRCDLHRRLRERRHLRLVGDRRRLTVLRSATGVGGEDDAGGEDGGGFDAQGAGAEGPAREVRGVEAGELLVGPAALGADDQGQRR